MNKIRQLEIKIYKNGWNKGCESWVDLREGREIGLKGFLYGKLKLEIDGLLECLSCWKEGC